MSHRRPSRTLPASSSANDPTHRSGHTNQASNPSSPYIFRTEISISVNPIVEKCEYEGCMYTCLLKDEVNIVNACKQTTNPITTHRQSIRIIVVPIAQCFVRDEIRGLNRTCIHAMHVRNIRNSYVHGLPHRESDHTWHHYHPPISPPDSSHSHWTYVCTGLRGPSSHSSGALLAGSNCHLPMKPLDCPAIPPWHDRIPLKVN
ncbi:hypothetical protein ABW21_db0200517 [Orbilia brochopaga]|nr:hypothetical protein ABW21_db0200517 [Drechslerella brochopaga]